MRLFPTKGLLALGAGGLFLTGVVAQASSPNAWEQHREEVTASCIENSGLRNAEPLGEIVSFSDTVRYDVLLLQGNYSQPMMNNQVGQFLCLFDRQTRQAYTSEANNFLSQGDRASGLPGQPIDQVLRWANNHSFLQPLQSVEKLESGYPDYQSVTNLGQQPNQSASYIAFEVYVNSDQIVTSQTIDYRDDSQIHQPLAFTQQDSEGLQLIQTVYGEEIKEDFVRSRHIRDEGNGNMQISVFASDRFTYKTWNDGSASQFSIHRLEDIN